MEEFYPGTESTDSDREPVTVMPRSTSQTQPRLREKLAQRATNQQPTTSP